jgi:hypothetical protein
MKRKYLWILLGVANSVINVFWEGVNEESPDEEVPPM